MMLQIYVLCLFIFWLLVRLNTDNPPTWFYPFLYISFFVLIAIKALN